MLSSPMCRAASHLVVDVFRLSTGVGVCPAAFAANVAATASSTAAQLSGKMHVLSCCRKALSSGALLYISCELRTRPLVQPISIDL